MLAGTQGGDGSAPSQLWESSLWHAFYSPGLSSQPVRPGDIAAVHRASFNSTSNSFSNMETSETTFLFSRIFKSLKVVLPVAGALLTIFVAAKPSEPGDFLAYDFDDFDSDGFQKTFQKLSCSDTAIH